MIATWRRLRQMGVTGINARNSNYVLRYNRRRYYPLVDDKLQTKRLAIQAGVATPELFGVIETEHDAAMLDEILAQKSEFVLKPAHGSGGNGVVIIEGRSKGRYRKASGDLISSDLLHHHISNTLNGLHSLGGHADKVMVEYRVRPHPVFDQISYRGVPDVRIIVLRGYPAMAMLRLPTQSSDGKANLHQGAIGVGLAIGSGVTTRGTWHNQVISDHPDTDVAIAGIQIPYWDQLLEQAARCCEISRLGYIGADFVIDQELGPLLLELNARPGLAIQMANGVGLESRLGLLNSQSEQTALEQRLSFVRAQGW